MAAIAASIASGVATGVATATGGCSWGRWRPLRRSDSCNFTDPWWASVYSSIGPRMGSCGCRGIYADNLILFILLITRPSRASSRVPRRTSSVLKCRRKASCFSSLFSTNCIMVLTSPTREGIRGLAPAPSYAPPSAPPTSAGDAASVAAWLYSP